MGKHGMEFHRLNDRRFLDSPLAPILWGCAAGAGLFFVVIRPLMQFMGWWR